MVPHSAGAMLIVYSAMGKIFLKMPSMIVSFYRGEDPNNILACDDSYSFPRSSPEYQALLAGLRFSPVAEQIRSGCYSHNSWRKMLQGRSLEDNQRVLVRDKSSWLSQQEVCILTDKPYNARQDIFDYLCIDIPKFIYIDEKKREVKDTYSLDVSMSRTLQQMMRAKFYHVLAVWYRENERVMDQMNLSRTKTDFIYRFLTAHEIAFSGSHKEADSIRKQIDRGIGDELILKNKREQDALKILYESYSDEKLRKFKQNVKRINN